MDMVTKVGIALAVIGGAFVLIEALQAKRKGEHHGTNG